MLPAYQAAGFIQPTLDSISAQSSPNFEVIVSVDLCDDATFDVCMAHAARDQRFRVVKQDSRLGYVGNCNYLLSQAREEFQLFAFHDDTLAPTYVEKLSTALRDRPTAALSYSDLDMTYVDGTKEHWEFTALDGISSRTERGLIMAARKPGWWVPNRGMFRMNAARRVNGLKTHSAGEFSPDWPWLFHLSLTGEFVRVPETLCFKFYKPGSLSRSWDNTPAQWYAVTVSCMREIWNSDLLGEEKVKLAMPLMAWLVQHRPQNFHSKRT
jgi:glycosyltransferase involved in cell wall biosynthesis